MFVALGAVVFPVAPAASSAPGRGVFHTVCAYSHSLPDDPIVHPGSAGASHMHDFFGNASTSAFSTLASLQAGTANCFVHASKTDADHSGYWVPQLIFNGTPTPFVEAQAYYDSTVGAVKTPPSGLELIGGNAHATAPLSTNIVKWTCSGSAGSTVGARTAPPVCPSGSTLKAVVQTPNCLADAEFKHPGGVNDTPFTTYAFLNGGSCPSGYDPLPSVRIEVKYPAGVDGRGRITLSSGPYFTMHADWFNAWDHATLNALVNGCIDADVDCGNTVPGPTAPRWPTAQPGSGTATVHWTVPSSNNGSAITGYVITPDIGTTAQPASAFMSAATTETIIRLANGKIYTFRVAAKNANGISPQSVPTSPVTVGAPTAPTQVSATPGNSRATLNWTAPASNNGSAITGYVITPYIGTTAQTPRVFNSTATSETLSGLTNGTTYTFKVAARNAEGTGPKSTASAPITVGALVAV